MSNYKHRVEEDEANERLDKVLVGLNESYARHQIQSWIKAGNVLVNDKVVKANYKCRQDDLLTWYIEEKEQIIIKAEAIPLEIVFEDDSLIVINKPKGMLVHPTEKINKGTLVNALKHYSPNLSTLSGEERPGIVHRLDQHTSGLIVVCKDNASHEHLKKQFKEQSVTRQYEAIVHGVVAHERGVIKAPIGRNPKNRLKRTVVDDGKYAETRFHVLGRGKEHTHVACQLKTGRTHQIRVHLKYINHPIVGDSLYTRKKTQDINEQALFAKTLGFIHPQTNEYMEFTIEEPEYFSHLLKLYQINA